MDMNRGRFRAAVVLVVTLWTVEASAQRVGLGADVDVVVVSAEELRVTTGSTTESWTLGGVWTPQPTTGRASGNYLGEEARDVVEEILLTREVTVAERWAERGLTMVRLAVRPRENPEATDADLEVVDLAELLARGGLAMCDRPSAASREHGDRVCEAEREARRAQLGIHDGGFESKFEEYFRTVSLGQLGEKRRSGRGQRVMIMLVYPYYPDLRP